MPRALLLEHSLYKHRPAALLCSGIMRVTSMLPMILNKRSRADVACRTLPHLPVRRPFHDWRISKARVVTAVLWPGHMLMVSCAERSRMRVGGASAERHPEHEERDAEPEPVDAGARALHLTTQQPQGHGHEP